MQVPLIIAPGTQALARDVVLHAKKPENWIHYDVEGDQIDKEMRGISCMIPMGFLCIFFYAHYPDDSVYRVLSMQIPGRGIPGEYKAGELALMFGFTGWNREGHLPKDWHALFPLHGSWVSVMQELSWTEQ